MGDVSPVHPAGARARASNRTLTISLVVGAVFLYWSALYLYVPTLPTYVESKSDNLALVGVVLSMYGLWQALIRLPLGIVADWVGKRKPFIVGGFLLAGLGAWTMGMADSASGLLIGRAITGLAAGTWVPLVVLFSGLFPPEDSVKASAMLTLIGSGSRMLATGLTGTLNRVGGYSLAFFLAAGASACAIAIILLSSEQAREPKRPSPRSLLTLVTRRDVLLPSLLNMVSQYLNWATTFGFMPILARRLGASDNGLSLLTSLNLLVAMLGNLLATTIVNRIGARRLVYVSYTLAALGTVGAALSPSLPFLFAAQLCIGLSVGVGYPVNMGLSIRHVDDAERTTAMGLHQSVYAIGMFAGPAASGALADVLGIRPMFAVTAVVCLLLGLAGGRLLPNDRG